MAHSRSVLAFVPDAAFLLLSLRSVYVNLKEVVPALMAGLDGLINYLTFWKIVEWISLLFGVGCFILWVGGCILWKFFLFDMCVQGIQL